MIVVPLRYRGQVIGVLQIVSPELFAFGPVDEQTLQLMAGLIGAAMSHAAEFQAKQAALEALSEAKEAAEAATRAKSRVPGEHEPRDPHAHERHPGHDRAGPGHAADRRSSTST